MKKMKTDLPAMLVRFPVLVLLIMFFLCGTTRAALVDNGDGTVTDTVTCLMWQQASMDRTGDGIRDTMTWEQALYESEHLALAGYSDWRLPDYNELVSIVDYSRYNPAIDTAFFPDAVSSNYWSSTTFAFYTYYAWHVNFYYGYDYGNDKSSSYYVRAVRGGQCGSFGYFGRIHQTPMEGIPGTTFTQSGWAFTPNSTVTLHFRNQLGEPLPSQLQTTDANGAFTIDSTTPPDKPVGTHTWWAVDDISGRMSEPLGYRIIGATGQETPLTTGTVSENLPAIRENVGFGQLTSEGDFDPSKETFVIVHGWNTSSSNDLPSWMTALGYTIKNDTQSWAKDNNVLYWNWQEKAKTKIANAIWDNTNDESCMDVYMPGVVISPVFAGQKVEIPYDETKESGKDLANAIRNTIPESYNQNIHFIGHSLGTLVSTYAAKYARKHDLHFGDRIKHLVFLDSPCYFGVTGGDFLENNTDIFFENYMSMWGRPYKAADVDIWLQPKAVPYGPVEAHAYPYYWYWSSVTNFDDQDILGDSSAPASTMPWGFYWWNETNRIGVESDYSQLAWAQHYLLDEGTPVNVAWDLATGIIVDLAGLYAEATVDVISQIADYALWAGKSVTILSTETYNTVTDVAGYVTDVSGHAVHSSLGWMTLLHSSTAVLSMPVDIPIGANALSFGVEFLYGESGSMLEVFINDVPLFHTTSDLALGEGLQLIPWINVEPFAGQSATLTLRISNPNPDTEGKILIDDLVIAKIEAAKSIFPWAMFLPSIIGGQQ